MKLTRTQWFAWRRREILESTPGPKYCTRCGHGNDSNATYCSACGGSLAY
jgi:hypothetical protein